VQKLVQQIVSIDDRFIDNQSVHVNIKGELFSINAFGSISPLNIVKVEDFVYGLSCSDCQEYGYDCGDIPHFPQLYYQENLFKKVINLFPNSEYTVVENPITHETRYKIKFCSK
jgi:hypothetical protein